MTDGLTPERVYLAMARPAVGEELLALGFRVFETMGTQPGVMTKTLHVPQDPEIQRRGRELVDAALAGGVPEPVGPPVRKTKRGRTMAEVSRREADEVARIYMRDRSLSGYAVWRRYNRGQVRQAENPKLLSKNMVGHLIEALNQGWLGWDESGQRILGEFRTSQATFVIPRGKPAS